MTFGVTLQSGGGIPGCEPGVFPPVCSHPPGVVFLPTVALRPTRSAMWSCGQNCRPFPEGKMKGGVRLGIKSRRK